MSVIARGVASRAQYLAQYTTQRPSRTRWTEMDLLYTAGYTVCNSKAIV